MLKIKKAAIFFTTVLSVCALSFGVNASTSSTSAKIIQKAPVLHLGSASHIASRSEEMDICEQLARQRKRMCESAANNAWGIAALTCLRLIHPARIAVCEVGAMWTYNEAKLFCESRYDDDIIACRKSHGKG